MAPDIDNLIFEPWINQWINSWSWQRRFLAKYFKKYKGSFEEYEKWLFNSFNK